VNLRGERARERGNENCNKKDRELHG